MKVLHFIILCNLNIALCFGAKINVSSLTEFNNAIEKSGNTIILEPGQYDLEELPASSRVLLFSGSDNKINLKGVYIKSIVGTVTHTYIYVTGNNNTIEGGEFEDVYKSGLTKVTDFSAYNKDRKHHAFGLSSSVMRIDGDENLIKDLKLTVRGSWPYGYGSYYGIGGPKTFGLNKRSALLVRGDKNTIDGAEIQQRAFGHGIFMQLGADQTLIKNCHVEGRVRKTADLYNETDPDDIPRRANYRFPNRDDFQLDSPGSYPIPKDEVFSLSEDGIRMYSDTGSVTVENCVVRRMRGGIRLYLGGSAVVKNCTVQHCQYTAYNLPKGGQIIDSAGDFSFGPLSDYRSSRSGTTVEWTIIPSPYASGSHNLMNLQGNNHHITLKLAKGNHDSKVKRSIVITGSNSTIINKTKYPIILEENATGNSIRSFGSVTDNGAKNKITKLRSLN